MLMLHSQESWCNTLYNACRDDRFCFGSTPTSDGSAGFWSQAASCGTGTYDHDSNASTPAIAQNSSQCRKFSDIFANGTQACQQMWRSSGVDAFVVKPVPPTPADEVIKMAGPASDPQKSGKYLRNDNDYAHLTVAPYHDPSSCNPTSAPGMASGAQSLHVSILALLSAMCVCSA